MSAVTFRVPYVHHDLGRQKRGATAVVTLSGTQANVRLLDSSGLSAYKRGASFRAIQGLARSSPVRLAIPRDGHWNVVVDLLGLRGHVESSVYVEPPPLAPFRSGSSPLTSIAANAAEIPTVAADEGAEAFDVFVSHATEDKDSIVRPLVAALQDEHVRVWYDEFELRIGDSLRRKIDSGLAGSRFGVVVLSKAFFSKNWPQYELDGLVTREMAGGRQVILPLWHEISRDEIISRSPTLADKVALRTSDLTLSEIAQQIADVVADV